MQHFDPVYIIYQIIAMQAFYYLSLGTFFGLCHAMFDIKVSLDHFFTAKFVNFVSPMGWMVTICILLTGLMGYVILSIAKLLIDSYVIFI
jgi:hypothetical protein